MEEGMNEWFEREIEKVRQQMDEYDRWWRQPFIFVLVRYIALAIFAAILVWSIL
jgi:hypothetical protein